MGAERREPWPIALALALASMIAVCVAFYAIAATHPDPPLALEHLGLRPSEGYVAGGGGAPPGRTR
jgi:hypothetical protein